MFFANANNRAIAAQSYSIAAGNSIKVDEWGTCKNVINSIGSPPVFIPTKTADEWQIFINHRPSHITFSECFIPKPIPPDASIYMYIHGCGYGKLLTLKVSNFPITICGDGNCGNPAPWGGFEFTFSKQGNYIKIESNSTFLWANYNAPCMPGGIINAVGFSTPATYPAMTWASKVISHKLGVQGIEASVNNVLGSPDTINTVIHLSCWSTPMNYWAFLGDYKSEIVVAF
ncbi:MAG: hypothetical protein WCX69_00315 [Candidatus Paceibacterota bacterium]